MSEKKIILVTGANTGLGYEIIKALYQSSQAYEIIIGTRDAATKGAEAASKLSAEIPSSRSTLSTLTVDVTSDDSIAQAAAELKRRHGRLDVLINNAGASYDAEISAGKKSAREAWNSSWDVNVTGTHLLTEALAPLLLAEGVADPRLFFITSGTSPLAWTEDLEWRLSAAPPKGWPKPPVMQLPAYRSSKTGMNMMAREWERVLRNDGVKVFIISPGMLATGLGGFGGDRLRQMGAEEPSVGGDFVKRVVEGERDADAGKAINRKGIQPW